MILGFKQKFPWGQPTYFREKILAGVGYAIVEDDGKFCRVKPKPDVLKLVMEVGNIKPKIHTMRKDPHDRWKEGMSIQMAYGVRTKDYEQFNKGIPELEKCNGIQRIKIEWRTMVKPFGLGTCKHPFVIIDDKEINGQSSIISELAVNDGFKDLNDFFRWFNKDFKGKIIHFTHFKY